MLSIFNLGAALAAGFGIGAGYAGAVTGSTILLIIALLCAVICALLQAIAFQRLAGDRLDALMSGLRSAPPPTNDDRGRC